MRCSDEVGAAGRAGDGLAAAGLRAPIGFGLAAVFGLALLAVDRRAGFFALFFRSVPVFPRAALPTSRFLRFALTLVLPLILALPLIFLLVAIAAS